jgi:hypothetical protein
MIVRRVITNQKGASAAEFAMVLPLLLILLFSIIDGGRFAWEYNRAEKATQAGARVAVVTNSFPSGLVSQSYVGQTVGGVTLTQGDLIPAAALGLITCTRAGGCACTTSPCPANPGTLDAAVFDNVLLTRMRAMKPDIQAANVRLKFRGSGLGFAGDPNGMEIAPLVTVELTGMQFRPITSLLLLTFTMPDFRTTLTAEDASGTQSN